MSSCSAIQQSDEMYCARCALRWDVNDSDPPPCRKSVPSDKPKTTSVKLSRDDLRWIVNAFNFSTPDSADMEPGERAAYKKIDAAYSRMNR